MENNYEYKYQIGDKVILIDTPYKLPKDSVGTVVGFYYNELSVTLENQSMYFPKNFDTCTVFRVDVMLF